MGNIKSIKTQTIMRRQKAVSYTHLDVYKRQGLPHSAFYSAVVLLKYGGGNNMVETLKR